MKQVKIMLALVTLLLLHSCWGYGDDELPSMRENYRPLVMQRAAFESAVQLQTPQDVVKAGKIYIKDNLLFVTEVNKGFHVYDYANAQNPVEVAYIKIPGATDLAVRGTTLYINQATDLVALTYANNTLTVTKRNRNVFPQKEAPDDSHAHVGEDEIITDWIHK